MKDKDGDLELDAPVANLLIRFKDLFLGGAGTRQLEQIANVSGITAARGGKWHRSAIEKMLVNPFYAGKVFNGRWKMVRYIRVTPRGKRASIMELNADAPLYDGNHPALWTYEEHLRIVAEMEERYKFHPRRNPHNFSGLLVCSVCGNRLGYKGNYYRCYPGTDHIKLKVSRANEIIPEELAKALRDFTDAPQTKPVIDTTADAIAGIDKQIAKVQELALKEIYNATEAKAKVDALRAEKGRILASQQDATLQASRRARLVATRDEMIANGELETLPTWFQPPMDEQKNNRFLRNILSTIHITPDHNVTFVFR